MSSKQNTIDMNYKKELSKRFGTTSYKTSPSSIAIALIGGIAIGTVVSLLFAPQSGEDTRDMISSRSRDLKDGLKDQIKSLKKMVRENSDELADKAKDKYNSVKQGASDVADNAKDKLDTAKDKYNAVKNGVSNA
jgi:gas vesicle protein